MSDASGRAKPADQFERRLREAVQRFVELRQTLSGLLEYLLLLFQPFLFTLDFSGVAHALLCVPVAHQQQRVVHNGYKVRLHFFGRDARCPRFLLL